MRRDVLVRLRHGSAFGGIGRRGRRRRLSARLYVFDYIDSLAARIGRMRYTAVRRFHQHVGLSVIDSAAAHRVSRPHASRTDPPIDRSRSRPALQRQGRRAARRRLDGHRLARPQLARAGRCRRRAARVRDAVDQAALRAARRGARAAQPPQPDGRRRRAVVRLRALCAHHQRDAGACSTRSGYALVLAEHHYDLGAELRITEQLMRHGVDAFVFVGLHHDPALFALLERLRPALRADLGRRSDAAASQHRLRQPRRDLRDDAPPDRARPSPLRPAQRADRRQRPRDASAAPACARRSPQAGLALDERCVAVRADRRSPRRPA